jgi:hypothetical protein
VSLAAVGIALYLFKTFSLITGIHSTDDGLDFRFYYQAAVDLAAGRDIYGHYLQCCTSTTAILTGYIYPPLLAELFRPLTAVPVETALRAWYVICLLMLVGAVACIQAAVGVRLSPTARAWLLAATLFFLPLYDGLRLGQIHVLVLLVTALAALAFVRAGSGPASGSLLGVGTLLRFSPVLLAPMLLRRGPSRQELSGVVSFVAVVAVGAAALAIATPTTVEFVSTVLPRLTTGTSVYINQSIPGLLLRFQYLAYPGHVVEGFRYVVTALAVLLVGLTWWRGLGVDGVPGRAAVFASLLAVLPMVSSVTWNHHLTLELLVIALLAPSLRPNTAPFWLGLAGYFLVWIPETLPIQAMLAVGLDKPTGLGLLVALPGTSVNMIGEACLWVAALLVLRRLRSQPSP